jgi:hypothetical protein
VTAVDSFGAAVVGATIVRPQGSSKTDAQGGALSSRSGVLPTVSSNGQALSFEIELVVVDGDSKSIDKLSAANFVLRACTPAPADSLANLGGGDTPLYQSLDTMVGASTIPAGLAKAVVVFTDGADTRCGSPEDCRSTREQSIRAANQDQVRLFTIGLSKDVDVATLGELASQTGGAFLYADSIEQLIPLYGSVGKLLSLSRSIDRQCWALRLEPSGTLRPAKALLGREQVAEGSSNFELSYISGAPREGA